MKKHKIVPSTEEVDRDLVIKGEVGRLEIVAAVCDVFMLSIFLYNQIFYGINMLFLIIPLIVIGLYLLFFGIIPEKYRFTDTSLEIWRISNKTATIFYDQVFNLEVTARDGFVNLLQDNKVKIYHTAGKSKRSTICKPRDVDNFAKELKKRCPEFAEDGQNSKLEVFFKK